MKLCSICQMVEIEESKSICLACKETQIELVNKKRKREKLVGLISTIIFILIGLSLFWGSTVYSEEKVIEKFYLALTEEDKSTLRTIIYHDDYTKVDEYELDALIYLVDKHGLDSIKTYYRLDTNSKVMGIFDKYDILMKNQYIRTEKTDELIDYEINGQQLIGTIESNGQMIIGPLLPGIYFIKGRLENTFGTFEKEQSISLIAYDEKPVETNLYFKTGYTQFIIEDYFQHELSNVSIALNGQKLIIEDGKTAMIGPLVFDDLLKYKVVVQTPWGEIISEEQLVKQDVNHINLRVVNEEFSKQINKVIETYGHQRAQSIAKADSEYLTVATENHKRFVEKMFVRIDGYKGRLTYSGFDREAVYLKNLTENQTQITILALLKYEEAYYIIGQDVELYEETYPFNIRLIYYHDTGELLVDQVMNLYNVAIKITDEAEVEPTLFEPDEDKIQAALNEQLEEVASELVSDGSYFASLVLTNQNMYFIQRIITTEGKINKQMLPIIQKVREMKEQFYYDSSKVISFQEVNYDKWKLTAEVVFTIYQNEEEIQKTFKTEAFVVFQNGKFLFDEIISYKEIKD